MGKGGFRVKKVPVKVEEVKTFGKEAIALCGFFDFGTLPTPPSPSYYYETYYEEVVEEGKGKEKEESEEEKKARLEREEEEEREREMREYEYGERELDAVSYWEEHHHFEMNDSLWLEEECSKWDWKMFGNKWERKAHSRRERRPTRSLKKEKIDPKRYVRSRNVNTAGAKITFQPRSVENYLPSKSKKNTPFVPPPVSVSSSSSSSRSRRYVPADYQPRYVAPVAPVARWEPVPASILNPVQPRGSQVARQHQANRGNLDENLKKTLENSVVAAPSGKKYTPEQAARMLIEMQQREITPEDFALLSVLDECLEKKTVGKDAIEKLPVGLWKELKDAPGRGSSSESPEETCRVCLLEYEDPDELITLPCHHLFHKECIREWLSNSSTACPLDGQEVSA